jgi:drug/metabolite transporter, DME family
LLGVLVYGDRPGILQLVGSLLIVISVVAVNISLPARKQKKHFTF